jgi:hypothetical protein
MGAQGLCCNLINIPSGILPGVEFLDYMAVLVLDFLGASILLSIVVVLTYFPTNVE